MTEQHTTPDFRRIEQFVAVAEAGTLAAAAEQLFLTQQALSTAIRKLEAELGVDLFDRSGRTLALTAAGHDLVRGARPLLTGAQRLGASVRRTAAGTPPAYVIGHSPALSGGEVFTLIESAVAAHPNVSVTIRQTFPAGFDEDLISGRVDLVLRRGVETPADLTSAIVGYQRLRIAVAASHPLAERETISVTDDLADQPITVWAPEGDSFYTDFLVAHCRRSGIEPVVRISRIQGAPPATAVLVDDRTCAFVTESPGPMFDGRVVVKDFDVPPLSPVQALWPSHTVSDFRTTLLTRPGLLGQPGPPPSPTAP